MDGLMLAFTASLLLGMRHATDPDHVVAVTTIVNGGRRIIDSSRVGIMWGLGHTLTIVVVGGAIVIFKLTFAPRVELSLEFAVALMLLVLGYLNLRRPSAVESQATPLRPFAIGAVHGMAGSAAATLLIVPLIADSRVALLHLVVFGFGTIVGMTVVTLAIAAPAIYAVNRVAGFQRHVRLASGCLSVAFGLWLGYKVGFVDGLFMRGVTGRW